MLKLEGAVILFPKLGNQVRYLVGNDAEFQSVVFQPFASITCDFLREVSKSLMQDKKAREYSDVVSFAYWCRRANVDHLRKSYIETSFRMGRGLIFHVAPSNVPVNFAFSFAFSLLAGNSNIVRVPSKNFAQVDIICATLQKVLNLERFSSLKQSNLFVTYERDDAITARFSENCDGRIIWGGSQTINSIRKLYIPERSIEITFADRYSFCVINAAKLSVLEEPSFDRLISGFYNDTYLMDQNACSSPHFILWIGEESLTSRISKIFWSRLAELVQLKYELEPVMAVDKLTNLYQSVIENNEIERVDEYGNAIYVLNLSIIPPRIDKMRGLYGHFYQYRASSINEIAPFINQAYQTLTYHGVEKEDLIQFVKNNKLSGIDRVVPIGDALDISVIWDGYDLIRSLSRIIEIV
jgi:hypothetical protein